MILCSILPRWYVHADLRHDLQPKSFATNWIYVDGEESEEEYELLDCVGSDKYTH